ncbi:hypothetical protein B0H10DRAFT_2242648 [Mycena sp. CBHHK59/15]|nr:hypothetical protein B0H10DRAFT_2242648 [Mycena sp. CBHHK59/15]
MGVAHTVQPTNHVWYTHRSVVQRGSVCVDLLSRPMPLSPLCLLGGDVSRRVALVLVSLMHLLLGGHGASTLYADACISHMPLCLWGTLQQSRPDIVGPSYPFTWAPSSNPWADIIGPCTVAANHAAWGPISGASMPRGPHRSFTGSGSQRLGKAPAKVKPVPPPTASIFFVLYPLPMFHSMLDDGGYPELYPRSPRLHDGDWHYLHAAHHSLVFEYPVPVDPSHVFYADFNDWLLAEMRRRMLHFSPSFATTHPLFNTQPDTPACHAMRFLDFKWSLVKIGNKQRAEREDAGRILTLSDHQWHAFTVSGLKASKLGLNNPGTVGQSYYLIAPRGGPILGPPLGVSTLLVHRCFALRFLAPLDPYYDADQQITCFEDCDPLPLDANAELPASSAPGCNAGPVRQARLGAQDAPVDSDEEASQLERALADSVAPTNAVAGPSRRPLPTPPVVRAQSTEPVHFLFQWCQLPFEVYPRHLDPLAVDA